MNLNKVRVLGSVQGKDDLVVTYHGELDEEIDVNEGVAGSLALAKGGTAAQHKVTLSGIAASVLLHCYSETTYKLVLPHGSTNHVTAYGPVLIRMPGSITWTSFGVTQITATTAVKFSYFVAATTSAAGGPGA